MLKDSWPPAPQITSEHFPSSSFAKPCLFVNGQSIRLCRPALSPNEPARSKGPKKGPSRVQSDSSAREQTKHQRWPFTATRLSRSDPLLQAARNARPVSVQAAAQTLTYPAAGPALFFLLLLLLLRLFRVQPVELTRACRTARDRRPQGVLRAWKLFSGLLLLLLASTQDTPDSDLFLFFFQFFYSLLSRPSAAVPSSPDKAPKSSA